MSSDIEIRNAKATFDALQKMQNKVHLQDVKIEKLQATLTGMMKQMMDLKKDLIMHRTLTASRGATAAR